MKSKLTVKQLLTGKNSRVEILTTKVQGGWNDVQFTANSLGFYTDRIIKNHVGFSEYYVFIPKKDGGNV